jgi:hypothetical protein
MAAALLLLPMLVLPLLLLLPALLHALGALVARPVPLAPLLTLLQRMLAAPALLLLPGGPGGRSEEETGCEEEEEWDSCSGRHGFCLLVVASSGGAGSGASAAVFVARSLLYVARWRGYVEGSCMAGEEAGRHVSRPCLSGLRHGALQGGCRLSWRACS